MLTCCCCVANFIVLHWDLECIRPHNTLQLWFHLFILLPHLQPFFLTDLDCDFYHKNKQMMEMITFYKFISLNLTHSTLMLHEDKKRARHVY